MILRKVNVTRAEIECLSCEIKSQLFSEYSFEQKKKRNKITEVVTEAQQ